MGHSIRAYLPIGKALFPGYRPRSRGDNTFGSVRLFVCLIYLWYWSGPPNFTCATVRMGLNIGQNMPHRYGQIPWHFMTHPSTWTAYNEFYYRNNMPRLASPGHFNVEDKLHVDFIERKSFQCKFPLQSVGWQISTFIQ